MRDIVESRRKNARRCLRLNMIAESYEPIGEITEKPLERCEHGTSYVGHFLSNTTDGIVKTTYLLTEDEYNAIQEG